MDIITKISKNVAVTNANPNLRVLLSYFTPVAVEIIGKAGNSSFLVTDTFYSVTTARHINQFLKGNAGISVSQNVINDLSFA